MQDQSPNQLNDELLNEEVSPEEMREILERLGQREFGGSPNSTIRDIAEGTSADPVLIGRLLSEIRNEELQNRLGLQVEKHEQRIEHIEHVQAEVQREKRTYDPLAGLDADAVEELRNVAEERVRQKEMQPVIIAILLILIFGSILAWAGSSGKKGSYQGYKPKTTYSITVNGVVISGSPGGKITANDHGKVRPATEQEEMQLLPFMALSESKENQGR